MARINSPSACRPQADAVQSAAPGLLAGTGVLTLDGELPVEFLSVGDRVVTRSGARALRRIEMRHVASAQVVRIDAGTLGHDRPDAPLTVAAGQLLFIRDWRAKALYGPPTAMIPAARIADGSYIRRETLAEARLFVLEFDAEETIYAEGVEVGCAAVTVEA